MSCKFFKCLHFPSSLRRFDSNIMFHQTICGFHGPGNSNLTAKTRLILRSVPKKLSLQVQILSAITEDVFQMAEISTRKLSANLHAKSAGRISFRCVAAGASKDQSESDKYDVFISFRGETRTGFTSHLHKRLTQAGLRTFIDNSMKRGQKIEEEINRAIRNSKLSVVVISQGYASSHSCLDELQEILLCRKRFGHNVLPAFYNVDPDEVYYQKGNFGATFEGLVQHHVITDKRVSRWKEALKEIAGISGLVLHQYEYETDFIEQIVTEVKELLGPTEPQRVNSFVVLSCFLLYLDSIQGFKVLQLLNHMLSVVTNLL